MALCQRHARLAAAVSGRSSSTLLARPASLQRRRQQQQQHICCRAEADNTPPATTTEQQQQEQSPEQQQQQPAPAAPSAPLLAPGQGTAIVTGAISILFGIAYLVLVSLLDMRGGELQPPPPEAFMQ